MTLKQTPNIEHFWLFITYVLISNAYIAITIPTSYSQEISQNIYGDFKVSAPQGVSGRIAFTAQISGNEQILVLDLDSQELSTVTRGSGNNSYPSWSPDGYWLAFSSDRDGKKNIYKSTWYGGEQVRLTDEPFEADNPAWSPNGSLIAFYSQSTKDGKKTNITVINPDGKERETLVNIKGRNSTPAWSKDSSLIAYSTNRNWPGWDICIYDIKKRTGTCPLQGTKTFCRPKWANKSNRIVYSHGFLKNINLGILDLPSDKVRLLPELSEREYDAEWSPNDNFIAFVNDGNAPDKFDLYMLNLDSGEPSLVLSSPYSIRFLSWTAVKTIDAEAKRIILSEKNKESHSSVTKE